MSQLTFSDLYTARDESVPTRRVRWRLGVCVSAWFGWFFLSALLPIPYILDGTITQEIMRLVAPPARNGDIGLAPGSGFATYFFVATLVAFALAQPVHTYQGLALVGPTKLAERRRPRALAALQLWTAFLTGIVVTASLALPALTQFLLTNSLFGLEVMWQFSTYILFATHLAYLGGLAFQLPLWPNVLVRFGIASRRALERTRRYVLLAVVMAAAWITPTTDLLSMTVVAAPLYMFYEAGLLVARLIGDDDSEQTSLPNLTVERRQP